MAENDQEMNARAQQLIQSYSSVLSRVRAVPSPSTAPVRLVAVSKLKPASDVLALYNARESLGQEPHFGENYVQELIEKAEQLPKDIQWHFIGGLQSNKIPQLTKIPNLWAIESIDSFKKAEKVSKSRSSHGLPKINIFLQVNTSGEESKSGCAPEEATKIALEIKEKCEHVNLKGFMTIGAIARSVDHENPNEDFLILKKLRDETWEKLGKEKPEDLELSMGMSEDFEEAIKIGATNVRVGSTIFGSRPPKNSA